MPKQGKTRRQYMWYLPWDTGGWMCLHNICSTDLSNDHRPILGKNVSESWRMLPFEGWDCD